MNEQQKQYQQDVESGYPEPWTLWEFEVELCDDNTIWHPCSVAIDFNLDMTYHRLPNADQIILDWQKAKYAEDAEWHPRPWELWELRVITVHAGEIWYPLCSGSPAFDGNTRYRRRTDAPPREQWEAEQEPKKEEREYDPLELDPKVEAYKQIFSKCRSCRHEYEAKPCTIHIEADLPEPMREEPKVGDMFFLVCHDGIDGREWGKTYKETEWFNAGLCHRTEADARAWLDFFKQWRTDKWT